MTREEAIKVINNHLEHWKRLVRGKVCDETEGTETISAFEVAISALEQEPCDECIFEEGSKYCVEHCPHEAKVDKPCEDVISDIMGISKSRTHDIMENELRCVQRASCGGCDRECGECPLLMDDKEIIKAYGYVIRMLELPSVTPKPTECEDAISREAVVDRIKREEKIFYTPIGMNSIIKSIEQLPSVTPSRRYGAWIWSDEIGRYVCDKCGQSDGKDKEMVESGEYPLSNYCNNCGAKMVKESSDDSKTVDA